MKESRLAKNYFESWAQDYNAAFEGGQEDSWLQKIINRFFRNKTFKIREAHLSKLVKGINVRGKTILDIGCGTGQLALNLAQQGALVTGWDISPAMIAICQKKAKNLGLKAKFEVKDLVSARIPKVDIIFNIAVIEYYEDFAPILTKMLAATGETLVLTDARFIWWRAFLRRFLARIKNFPIHYHDPQKVKMVARANGFRLKKEYNLHSFRTLVFEKR